MDSVDKTTSFFEHLFTVIVYLVLGCALSIIYILLNRNSTYIYLCALTPILFSFFLSWILKIESKIFKIEKLKNIIIISLICGVFISHFKWSYYDSLRYADKANELSEENNISVSDVYLQYPELDKGTFSLFVHPSQVFRDAKEISKTGTWSLDVHGKDYVKGKDLYAVWIVESILIIMLPSVWICSSVKRKKGELNILDVKEKTYEKIPLNK